jgi:hypothetical protein
MSGKLANDRACDQEVQQYITARGGGGAAQKKLIASLKSASCGTSLRTPAPPASPSIKPNPQQMLKTTTKSSALIHAAHEIDILRLPSEEEFQLASAREEGAQKLLGVMSTHTAQAAQREALDTIVEEVLRELIWQSVLDTRCSNPLRDLNDSQILYETWARLTLLRRVKVAACAVNPRVAEIIGLYLAHDFGNRDYIPAAVGQGGKAGGGEGEVDKAKNGMGTAGASTVRESWRTEGEWGMEGSQEEGARDDKDCIADGGENVLHSPPVLEGPYTPLWDISVSKRIGGRGQAAEEREKVVVEVMEEAVCDSTLGLSRDAEEERGQCEEERSCSSPQVCQ